MRRRNGPIDRLATKKSVVVPRKYRALNCPRMKSRRR
jgi:hypothetical protein